MGLSLLPRLEFLERCVPAVESEVDYFLLAPEQLWWCGSDEELHPNGFHRYCRELRRRGRQGLVAGGESLSLGSACPTHADRRERWLQRMRAEQRVFAFSWWTEPIGATALDGLAIQVEVPLLPCTQTARRVRRGLDQMAEIVPTVAVRNSFTWFLLGEPGDDAELLSTVVRGAERALVLDLRSLSTMGRHHGHPPERWLAQLDLSRVIELQIGGAASLDAVTLRRGAAASPAIGPIEESQWALLEALLPQCSGLRGVTRLCQEGTVSQAQVDLLQGELLRLRELLYDASHPH